MPSSRGSFWFLMSPALAGGFFTTRSTWEAHRSHDYMIKPLDKHRKTVKGEGDFHA